MEAGSAPTAVSPGAAQPPVPAPPAPGALLLDWLARHGHTQAWLARALGVSQKHINRIAHGHAKYSAHLAVRLAAITAVPAEQWMRAQSDWELSQQVIAQPKHIGGRSESHEG